MLELQGDTLIAVGTDGRRLAKMEGAVTKVGDKPFSGSTVIVPSRSMSLIEKTCSDPEATIKIAPDDNSVLVGSPTTTIFLVLSRDGFQNGKMYFQNARKQFKSTFRRVPCIRRCARPRSCREMKAGELISRSIVERGIEWQHGRGRGVKN